MDATIAEAAQRIEHRWRTFARSSNEGTHVIPSGGEPGSLRSQVNNLWRQSPNWHTMVELNRRYLQRRLPVCAGYDQPSDPETDDFTNLLRLHDYGIISTNSCPGWEEPRDRQRAYLYFSIPTRNLATGSASMNAVLNFIRNLLDSHEVYAYIRFQYDNGTGAVQRDPQFSNLTRYGYLASLPESQSNVWEDEDWDIELDDNGDLDSFLFVNHQTRADPETDWEVEGHYAIESRGSAFSDNDYPFPASEAADPLQIAVIARDWNYREIGELIERLLYRSGISPGSTAEN